MQSDPGIVKSEPLPKQEHPHDPSDFGPIVTTGELVEVPVGPKHLPMMLYRATGAAAPGPCIVVCPGGTGMGLFEIMEWFCSRACSAGYTCLTVSWRAASPVGDTEDIAAALGWLDERGLLERGRAAVFGAYRGASEIFAWVTTHVTHVHPFFVTRPGRPVIQVSAIADEAYRQAVPLLQLFERDLANSPYLCGASPSVGDCHAPCGIADGHAIWVRAAVGDA